MYVHIATTDLNYLKNKIKYMYYPIVEIKSVISYDNDNNK